MLNDIQSRDKTLYQLVKQRILESLKKGNYQVGHKLPTEAELCKEYNVSRTTIRLALHQLELEGFIYRIQGKGTFVAKHKLKKDFNHAQTFTDHMMDLGIRPESKIVNCSVVPADSILAGILDINEGDPVIALGRIRFGNEEPLVYATSFIPWKAAPGLSEEECTGSLFQLLRTKYNIHLRNTIETIEPSLACEEIAEYLGIAVGSPVLLLECTTYDSNNVPIEYSKEFIRGDRIKFVVERSYDD